MKPENAFVTVQEGTLCLAIVVTTKQQPVPILGNLAQQNIHVGSPPPTAQGAAGQRSIRAAGRRAAGEEDGADGERDEESEDAAAVIVHLHRSRARAVSGVAGGSVSAGAAAASQPPPPPFSRVVVIAAGFRASPTVQPRGRTRHRSHHRPPDLLPTRQLPCWLL
uniref:Uncharacterized protein n=1 Tax=Oryza sativa subsp. japonica TaxID=39947 RepID=Q6Z3P8_ORYSJ|nr:hypothetical protein [Oryza sativa Japonica Group]